MENSNIGWTHNTLNFWIGCEKVSPGCKHCYAEADQATRRGRVVWGKHGTRSVTSYSNWRQLLRWDREAAITGKKILVFAQSLADTFEDFSGPVINAKKQRLYWPDFGSYDVDGFPVFDNAVTIKETDQPLTLEIMRAEMFKIIDRTPNLIYQMLTKRPENMQKMAPDNWVDGWPSNVWAGTSTENQEEYTRRVKHLLKVPAHKHFISAEPLLSNIELADSYTKWLPKIEDADGHTPICISSYWGVGLDWVIVGGESGSKGRAMQKAWAMNIQRQCKKYDVPFFFKQWGEHDEAGVAVGKKNSGELLDGVEIKQFPVF
jgi:protein gp37